MRMGWEWMAAAGYCFISKLANDTIKTAIFWKSYDDDSATKSYDDDGNEDLAKKERSTEQNNSSASVFYDCVHFFAVLCKICVIWERKPRRQII